MADPNRIIAFDTSAQGRSYLLTPLAASIFVLFAGGSTVRDAETRLSAEMSDTDAFNQIVERLATHGLLSRWAPQPESSTEAQWKGMGWKSAWDFHLTVDGYPFFDYSADGHKEDRRRMARYRRDAPDPIDAIKLSVQNASETVDNLDIRLQTMLTGAVYQHSEQSLGNVTVTAEAIDTLIDLAFSFRALPGKLRRTSPSGGARHPIHGYLWQCRSVNGINEGIYEVTFPVPSLKEIRETADSKVVLPGFYNPYSDFEPVSIVLLYSKFSRNRFRYREPRDFRAVLMDAGHLASTIQEIARSQGLRAHIHHGVDEDRLDSLLGAECLEDGFMIGVGIGHGGDSVV